MTVAKYNTRNMLPAKVIFVRCLLRSQSQGLRHLLSLMSVPQNTCQPVFLLMLLVEPDQHRRCLMNGGLTSGTHQALVDPWLTPHSRGKIFASFGPARPIFHYCCSMAS